MKGYVYIISNKAMPGIFKIGFTLKDPVLRAQQLNSTGIPHPFVVEYEILVDEPHDLEQRVHKILQEFNENKEWFRCSFAQAVQVIHTCYQGRIYYEGCFKTEREAEIERARQEKLHKEQQRLEAERKKQEEEELRLEQERLQQEEERKQAEQQKMWSYELGFSDDSPKRQPRTKAEYEEEMERAWREAEEARHRERIRQEQEYERIKVEQLERAVKEKKRLSEEKFVEEYRKTQPKQIIITCPKCGKKQCVENSPHIKAHCPLCLHNFEINFYKQIFDDGQFVYAWPEKENRGYGEKKFSKKDYEDDFERAWREEEERRRREREARKLQQEGKVIIACIECGQKLRVSNAPYLHVRCPKCSCAFYWENK